MSMWEPQVPGDRVGVPEAAPGSSPPPSPPQDLAAVAPLLSGAGSCPGPTVSVGRRGKCILWDGPS